MAQITLVGGGPSYMSQTLRIVLMTFSLLLAADLVSLEPGHSQQPLTGQQILEKVDARGGIGGLGSRVSFSIFEIVDKTGTKQEKSFVFFGKSSADPKIPNRTLIYFLAPPKETCGTIFLTIDNKVPGQKSDLFLYLPALGQVKQLKTTGERKGSFAGSNIQFDQVGRTQLRNDFNAQLTGEDTVKGVTVNGKKVDRPAYVLQLTANKTTNPDESFPKHKAWVDKEEFLVLKSEDTNTIDKLQNVSTLDNLVTFEGRLETSLVKVVNVLDNSSTTVTITDRENIGELSDSIFDPNGLAKFDSRQFNSKLRVKIPDPTCP